MLMNEKSSLRKLFSSIRKGIDAETRSYLSVRIASNLINSVEFRNSGLILAYVSFSDEVGTEDIIRYALSEGKKVAVPYWENKKMDFYYIKDVEDLSYDIGSIKTINRNSSELVTDYSGSLCIVPALSFDNCGNRLGFGGGYYDRFLALHPESIPVGICFERCISSFPLPAEEHDIPVKKVITENNILRKSGGITYE